MVLIPILIVRNGNPFQFLDRANTADVSLELKKAHVAIKEKQA